MSSHLSPSESRFVRALCQAGPLGLAPLGLARVLGVTTATVSNLSMLVERKGFCARERKGMRVFFHPTRRAVEWMAVSSDAPADETRSAPAPKKTRAPRLQHPR
jgi:hypothetical protein